MQAIQGIIEQKRAELSKLQEEIETLERAQLLLNGTETQKRRGRPKGSKNLSTAVKKRSPKVAKQTAAKGKRGRPKKLPAVAEL